MKLKITFRCRMLVFLAFFTFLGINSYAQERTCGMVELMQERMQDPGVCKSIFKDSG